MTMHNRHPPIGDSLGLGLATAAGDRGPDSRRSRVAPVDLSALHALATALAHAPTPEALDLLVAGPCADVFAATAGWIVRRVTAAAGPAWLPPLLLPIRRACRRLPPPKGRSGTFPPARA